MASKAPDLERVGCLNDSQNTPAITHAYREWGGQAIVTQGSNTTTLSFNLASQLVDESWSGDPAIVFFRFFDVISNLLMQKNISKDCPPRIA